MPDALEIKKWPKDQQTLAIQTSMVTMKIFGINSSSGDGVQWARNTHIVLVNIYQKYIKEHRGQTIQRIVAELLPRTTVAPSMDKRTLEEDVRVAMKRGQLWVETEETFFEINCQQVSDRWDTVLGSPAGVGAQVRIKQLEDHSKQSIQSLESMLNALKRLKLYN